MRGCDHANVLSEQRHSPGPRARLPETDFDEVWGACRQATIVGIVRTSILIVQDYVACPRLEQFHTHIKPAPVTEYQDPLSVDLQLVIPEDLGVAPDCRPWIGRLQARPDNQRPKQQKTRQSFGQKVADETGKHVRKIHG
jgi:hypothetical protein